MKKSIVLVIACLVFATVFSLVQVTQVSAISTQRADQAIAVSKGVSVPPGYMAVENFTANGTIGFYGSVTVYSGKADFKIVSSITAPITIVYFSILNLTYGDNRGSNWKYEGESTTNQTYYFTYVNTGTSNVSVEYSIYIDRTPPQVVTSSYIGGTDIMNGMTIGGNSYSFTVRCQDRFFPSYLSDCLSVKVDGIGALVNKVAGTPDQNYWLTIQCYLDTTKFSDGSHVISIILTDDVGNSITYTGTVFIDNNPFHKPLTWILMISVGVIAVAVVAVTVARRKKPEKERIEKKAKKVEPEKVTVEIMICPYCKAKNDPSAKFCTNCGASFE